MTARIRLDMALPEIDTTARRKKRIRPSGKCKIKGCTCELARKNGVTVRHPEKSTTATLSNKWTPDADCVQECATCGQKNLVECRSCSLNPLNEEGVGAGKGTKNTKKLPLSDKKLASIRKRKTYTIRHRKTEKGWESYEG